MALKGEGGEEKKSENWVKKESINLPFLLLAIGDLESS